MEVYIQAGQHNAALKQYQACEQILRKELGLDPSPETRALYKRIRKREAKSLPAEAHAQTPEPKHNLPSQLSTFIGREKEIDQVARLLRKHRLVTLAGAGGIGKTRLSLQVGQRLLNEHPHGVWFIGLDSLSDPDLVPQTIASVFELREALNRPVLEVLMHFLREKTVLLILDNCEHVLDACADLALKLLTGCPHLKILATSREVLDLTGGATYQMPSLSMPAGGEASLEQLSGYESVRLFIDRAALLVASFTLTEENAGAVIDICRKVDGIPLAIELAAAQVHMLQVSEILDQLQRSFALLSTDSRTALSRHQTLQASMDWSWSLLAEGEQKFMRQLAVFAGGWTLDDAAAIVEGDALDLSSALVKKSLIVVDHGPARKTRYRFHEIVRQYARQKLVEAGEEDEVRARHLHYFLELSKQIEPGLHGAQQMEWFAQATDERDNLRAALEYASRTDTEAGLYISGLLHSFWESINLGEGARWLATFIQRPESDNFPHAKTKALYTLGVLQIWSQHFAQAASIAEECLTLFRACGDQQGEADALILLGYSLQLQDRRSEADELYEQSLAVARSVGDLRRQALALFRLGYDRPERQLANWEEALALFRKAGDRNFAAGLLCLIARFRILLTGDIEKARKELDEAVELGLLTNKSIGIGGLWGEPGFAKSLIALLRGEYEQAYAILQEMLTLAQELGNRMGYLWTRAHMGHVALRAGDLTEARALFAETIENFQRDGNTIGAVFAIEGLAGLFLAVGKPQQAARLIGWADATRERILNPRPYLEQANVDKIIAACLTRLGEDVFSDEYEKGKKMALDEAVVYAVG
jgi:predicted ATPase